MADQQPLPPGIVAPDKEPPYWARVWPAAWALAQWVQQHSIFFKHRQVVELGAGLGLPGFVAASFAQQVFLSDVVPEAVNLLRYNQQQGAWHNVAVEMVDFSIPEQIPAGDIYLMSDLAYHIFLHQPLAELINRLTQAGACCLLTLPNRLASRSFLNQELPQYETLQQVSATIHGFTQDVLLLKFGGDNQVDF